MAIIVQCSHDKADDKADDPRKMAAMTTRQSRGALTRSRSLGSIGNDDYAEQGSLGNDDKAEHESVDDKGDDKADGPRKDGKDGKGGTDDKADDKADGKAKDKAYDLRKFGGIRASGPMSMAAVRAHQNRRLQRSISI